MTGETIVIAGIVAAAAGLLVRAFVRAASAQARGCACVDECPLSEACNPQRGECASGLLDTLDRARAERARSSPPVR